MNYDEETKVLTISPEFDEELKDLPEDIKEIIFEEIIFEDKYPFSEYNQELKKGVLPNSLLKLKLPGVLNVNH